MKGKPRAARPMPRRSGPRHMKLSIVDPSVQLSRAVHASGRRPARRHDINVVCVSFPECMPQRHVPTPTRRPAWLGRIPITTAMRQGKTHPACVIRSFRYNQT